MKKFILTCFVALIIASGYAQGLDLGIKAGANFANQDISGQGISLDTKSRASFHGGLFVTFMFSEKMGLQPELLYSIQGSKVEDFDLEQSLDYLSIPILFRYNINDMISLHAGPQLGLLMASELTVDGDKEDIKDDFNSTDFGIAVGGEVDLPMNLGAGIRYVAGLSDIVKEGESWDGAEIKNSVIQVYVKFKILNGTKK